MSNHSSSLLLLAALVLMTGACGTDPIIVVQDEYVVSGAAYCDVTRDGTASETFSIRGDIRIEEPFDSSPEGCEATATITSESCGGCAGPRCQVCLLDVRQEGGIIRADLAPAYADADGFASCSLEEWRGGLATMDFLFDGSDITGTLEHDTVTGAVSLDLRVGGTSSIGNLGEDVSSVALCEVNATRAE